MAVTLQDVRPEVAELAVQMELKLRKHDGDWGDGWRDTPVHRLFGGLLREVGELHEAVVNNGNRATRIGEAADVANFAMMVAKSGRAG